MNWDSIGLTTKLKYLEALMGNSTSGALDTQDIHIIRALITGSQNTHTHEDLRFDITNSHYRFMKVVWDTAMSNQKNNDVINIIKTLTKP